MAGPRRDRSLGTVIREHRDDPSADRFVVVEVAFVGDVGDQRLVVSAQAVAPHFQRQDQVIAARQADPSNVDVDRIGTGRRAELQPGPDTRSASARPVFAASIDIADTRHSA